MARQSGRVVLEGSLLRIRFPFSKKRFEKIKRFNRANFDKQKKSWTLPIVDYFDLQRTVGFRPNEIAYEIESEIFEQGYKLATEQLQLATQRWSSNPFSISEEDIFLLQPEVVIRLSRNRMGIRAYLRSYSKKGELLKSLQGVVYLSSERRYLIDPLHLANILKVLRDKEIRFAVEQKAAEALQAGAETRREYQHYNLSAQELKQAMLYPILDYSEVLGCFSCYGMEIDELKLVYPELNGTKARRDKTQNFDSRAALNLISAAAQGATRLYISSQAHFEIERRREEIQSDYLQQEHLPNAATAIVCDTLIWFKTFDGSLGLCVPIEHQNNITYALGDLASKVEWRDFNGIWQRAKILTPSNAYGLACYRAIEEALVAECVTTDDALRIIQELAQNEKARSNTQIYRDYKDCELSELPEEFSTKLFPHQRVAVKWLLETPHAFLGDDMGLGKTLSVLATTKALFDADNASFLLVIAPSSLLKNWQRECEQWIDSYSLHILPQSKQKRTTFLRKLRTYDTDWIQGLVTNFETARLDDVAEALVEVAAQRSTILCIDESQRAKNSQSKTFQALVSIADHASRRILLSGTPTPRDICDIWAQMRILDGGHRLGENYFEWLSEVAELGNKWSDFAIKRFKPEAVEHTISRVQEVLLRRAKEEVVSLPEKLFSVRDVALKGEQKKRYDSVCKDLLVQLSTVSGETYVREIDSILERFLRAVQIASNPRLVDETWSGEPAKFLELDEIISEVVYQQGKKIVVWTNFRANVEELVSRYKKLGSAGFSGETSLEQRAEIISRFQDPTDRDLSVLIAIPAAGGVGITLTAAQTAIYLDKTWNAEHWMQSVDRVHRIGQTGSVQILSLHSGRVDDIIHGNLMNKERAQKKLLSDAEVERQTLYPSREELIAALSQKS